MTKKQFKERLHPYYKNKDKLMFVRIIRDCINSNLRRILYELTDNMWQTSGFNKDFNMLWNLLNKEEKHYLRYKTK